jgi:hypothetical protein
MSKRLAGPTRRIVRDVEKQVGVKLRCEYTGGTHLRLTLPDGRFTIASLTGDGNAARATATVIRRMLRQPVTG